MSDVHPQIRMMLDAFDELLAEMGLTDIHSGGVDSGRAFLRALIPPEEALPAVHHVAERTIPGPQGEMSVRVYYPDSEQGRPVLMWFHGGGWVLGDLDTADFNCRKLANDSDCIVISVDYSLAPEDRFPNAIDDCYAATVWVAQYGDEWGIDPRRIAVGGDSAGGNLAACVALRAGENGPSLAMQLLIYPVIDADFDRPSYLANAESRMLTRDAMQWFWDCYVPDPDERMHPAVSPIHAADLTGLPPALVITAEYDPLRDEGEAYGAALGAAGVEVETKRYPGMIHGFFNMETDEPVAEIQAASADAAGALQRAFKED